MNKTLSGLLLLCLALPVSADTTLNLKDADINTLITTVSEVTGKNFIVDEKVKGKVTVISAKPMTTAGVYQTFLAVLAVKGFAVVQAGEVYKIVMDNNAKTEGGARIGEGGKPEDDIITHVYAIENVSAAQLVPILRPLVPQWGHLAAYTPSNMLIISDRASNVLRLQKLIEQIDRTGDREIEMVKLQHAGAADVVRILTTLTTQDKQADATVKPPVVIADERSNAVLIGGDKADRQKLLDIIGRLDIPLSEDGATQVVYLRYASAENLAPILEGYAQQAEGAGGAAAPKNPGGTSAAGALGTRIIADKDTNALVITAAPKPMRAIRNVIAQLDIKRSQVLVEAIIAEVSATKSNQLGIDWALFNDNRVAAAGILNPSTLPIIASQLATGGFGAVTPDQAGPALSGLTALGGVDNRPGGTSLGVLIKALQADGDTNVLSTPTLVATDNEESKLTVGTELSVPQGSQQTTAGNPFITNTQKTVGLILGLTPQINEGNAVKMKLSLEVSSLAAGTAGTSTAQFNKRNIETVVTVDSGQILVLGGLIDDTLTDTESGIPFLSSIPVLGTLFQSRKIEKTKRNLMIFIRPAIIRGAPESDYYTRVKYEAVRQSQIDLDEDSKSTILPRGSGPRVRVYEATDPNAPKAAAPPAPGMVPAPAADESSEAPASETPVPQE